MTSTGVEAHKNTSLGLVRDQRFSAPENIDGCKGTVFYVPCSH